MIIYKLIGRCPLFNVDYKKVMEGIFIDKQEIEKYLYDMEIISCNKNDCMIYDIIEANIKEKDYNNLISQGKIIINYSNQKYDFMDDYYLRDLN